MYKQKLTQLSLSLLVSALLVGCGGTSSSKNDSIEVKSTQDSSYSNKKPIIVQNIQPVALINGGQSTITANTRNVQLDAQSSYDNDGSITSYSWCNENGKELSSSKDYNCSFEKPGTYTRTLTVTDDKGATCTTTATIIVNYQAPIIKGYPNSRVISYQTYSFTPQASDRDGDYLTFDISNKPSWAFFDSSTGTLSGTPDAYDKNIYRDITITVRDEQGLSATLFPFSITVDPIKEWTTLDGTGTSNLIYGLSSDSQDNVITAGYTKNTGTTKDKFNVNVMKLSREGDIIWSKDFNSSAHEIGYDSIVDSAGNIYITGMTKGDFGDTNRTCGADKFPDPFVMKLDKEGNKLWGKLVCSDKSGLARGIGIDENDNVYITGNVNGDLEGKASLGKNDVFVAKFNSDGKQQYLSQLGSDENEYTQSMVVDQVGNAYVAGYTNGDMNGTNAGKSDIFVSKLDTTGSVLWTKQFGTTSTEKNAAITLNKKSSLLYITGQTLGDLGGINAGSYDVFLTAINLDGVISWTKLYGTKEADIGEDLVVTETNNIIIAGNRNITPAVGNKHSDILILKVAPDGKLLSDKTYGTKTKDYAYGIAISHCDSVFVGGYTRGNLQGKTHSGGTNDSFIMNINN